MFIKALVCPELPCNVKFDVPVVVPIPRRPVELILNKDAPEEVAISTSGVVAPEVPCKDNRACGVEVFNPSSPADVNAIKVEPVDEATVSKG